MANGVVTRNLLLDWRGEDFKNSPPTTVLPDRSGNGNTGNVMGFVYDGISDGSNGNGAIIFTADAINKSITTTNSFNPIPVIEAVFMLDRTPVNWTSIVNAYGGTMAPRGIAFFVHSDWRLGIHYWSGASRHYDLFSDVTFVINRKYHALLQYNYANSSLEFYLDGILRKTIYVPNIVLGDNKFSSGNWSWWDMDSYDWTGLLYQARAYSLPLTPEEILQNATYSLARYISDYKTIKHAEFITAEQMNAELITIDFIDGHFNVIEKEDAKE